MALPFRALFLGPAGENAQVVEDFLLEALRDHVFWRRNFHPEDGPFIRESDKRSEAYDASLMRLRQELYYLLSRLKQGAPLFSPRYIAHMTSDVLISSLVGYFAAMLYNPNNISEEAAPVTTELELEVGMQLARLVGYGSQAWGHLTSGGSVANLEALWVVRGVKFFPAAAAMVARELDLPEIPVKRADGIVTSLQAMTPWELMNVSLDATLKLRDSLHRMADPRILRRLDDVSIAAKGMRGFYRAFEALYGAPLPDPVLLVPATKHYSWVKIVDLLGGGREQIIELPLDEHYRIDPEAFRGVLEDLAASQVPVLSLVAVLGSTETGTVDEVHRLLEVKRDAKRLGLEFYCHVDGAYGGYATARFRDPQGQWVKGPYDRAAAASFEALPETDSITIDPHKLGYSPYPAGAIVFRDQRVREFLTIEAPYVFHDGDEPHATIGKYIVEGSKPGAAAAAVWINHRVLPLDTTGYGALISNTIGCARMLRDALASHRSPEGFRLIPLNDPDLNLVTFIAMPPTVASHEELNRFNEELYRRFAIHPNRRVFSYEFLLSKTAFDVKKYGRGLHTRLDPAVWNMLEEGRPLAVLRSTIMNPFTRDMIEDGAFFSELLEALDREMREAYAVVTAPKRTIETR
jgi:glutamate/tyrosine decarboxylase-like PLP-dependent enzyme